jgi:hypothetical protein
VATLGRPTTTISASSSQNRHDHARRGKKVSPFEIEKLLDRYPDETEAVVVAIIPTTTTKAAWSW